MKKESRSMPGLLDQHDRIDVPGLYLSGLNLRRNGGIRRGPRAKAGA